MVFEFPYCTLRGVQTSLCLFLILLLLIFFFFFLFIFLLIFFLIFLLHVFLLNVLLKVLNLLLDGRLLLSGASEEGVEGEARAGGDEKEGEEHLEKFHVVLSFQLLLS